MFFPYRIYGFLSLLSVVLLLIISFCGVTAVTLFVGLSKATTSHQQAAQSFYLAETGLESATHYLASSADLSRMVCNNTISGPYGGGEIFVSMSSIFISTPTVLTSSISSTDQTIPVASTVGYASAGRIYMGLEAVDYNGLTSTSFLNTKRGADSTVAISHSIGETIGQYQCALASSAGVPNLTSPVAKTILGSGVTLQSGLVSGQNNAGMVLGRWNLTNNQLSWTYDKYTLYDKTINRVLLLNSSDGWAVGETVSGTKPLIIRWNGSTWVDYSPTVSTAKALNGLACLNSASCWAVGDTVSSSKPFIMYWNGAVWSDVSPTISSAKALFSVACPAVNECWAVGDSGTIYRWNGSTWGGITMVNPPNKKIFDISCIGPGNCWGVGENTGGSTLLMVRLIGTTWSNAPITASSAQNLNGISCLPDGTCWAVGDDSDHYAQMLKLSSGTWTRYNHTLARDKNLKSVSCINQNDCWAVGQDNTFLHWDGTAWSQFSYSGFGGGKELLTVSLTGPYTQPRSGWSNL